MKDEEMRGAHEEASMEGWSFIACFQLLDFHLCFSYTAGSAYNVPKTHVLTQARHQFSVTFWRIGWFISGSHVRNVVDLLAIFTSTMGKH